MVTRKKREKEINKWRLAPLGLEQMQRERQLRLLPPPSADVYVDFNDDRFRADERGGKIFEVSGRNELRKRRRSESFQVVGLDGKPPVGSLPSVSVELGRESSTEQHHHHHHDRLSLRVNKVSDYLIRPQQETSVGKVRPRLTNANKVRLKEQVMTTTKEVTTMSSDQQQQQQVAQTIRETMTSGDSMRDSSAERTNSQDEEEKLQSLMSEKKASSKKEPKDLIKPDLRCSWSASSCDGRDHNCASETVEQKQKRPSQQQQPEVDLIKVRRNVTRLARATAATTTTTATTTMRSQQKCHKWHGCALALPVALLLLVVAALSTTTSLEQVGAQSAPPSQATAAAATASNARQQAQARTQAQQRPATAQATGAQKPPSPPPATSSRQRQPSRREDDVEMTTPLAANTTTTTTSGHLPFGPAASASTKLTGHLRFEFQRYDGWYNNLANSEWGTPNTRLRRKVAPAYSDGVYQMSEEGRPSARLLSQRMMRGEDGQASRRNLTTLFAFFGQVISSEILMASESGCPIEMHRIKIERCDPMYDRDCRGGRTMPFYRAAYDPQTGQSPNLPREQLNRVTSWIDGSFIYSTSETWLNTMRSFNGRGTLKMVAKPQSLPSSAAKSSPAELPGALGDAYLHDLMEALAAVSGESSEAPSTSTLNQNEAAAAKEPNTKTIDLSNVPMALFGYPVRNKQRAPLINHMPAHHLQMKKAERMFLLGDARTNQNPMLLSFGILFYRWHNVLAERIYRQHPDWSDEEIFQRARRLVIASLQNIFLYEYLPILLDTPPPYQQQQQAKQQRNLLNNHNNNTIQQPDLANGGDITSLYARGQPLNDFQYDLHDLVRPYTGYKPDLHPGISHAFQSSAFRFGHTLIPPGLYLRDDKCRFLKTGQGYKGVRLCSTWWNAEEVVSKVGIEQLLMGAASQIAEREDYVLCNDVRDKLYGPLDFSRRDLAALNIMRGRDNGLADYNTVRQAFKLARITRWRDINPQLYDQQPELFDELAKLYGSRFDQIDLYIGGMLESDLERGRPGPLFRRIIKEQFERLRDSDRFWFENLDSGIFSAAEVEEIRQIKLYDIIVNSTLIPDDAIQRDAFRHDARRGDPCPQPGQLSSSELQPCYIVKGHSYFKGNERTYLLVCLTLIVIPILCAVCAYCVVEYQDRKRRQFKAKQEYERNLLASRQASVASAGAGHQNKAYQEDEEEEAEYEEDDDDDYDDEHHDDDDDEITTSDESDSKQRVDAKMSQGEKHQQQQQHNSASDNTEAYGKTVTTGKRAAAAEKIYAKEWLHSNLKRKIKLRFGPEPDETIYVLDRRCQVQRKLNLSESSSNSVVVELSVDSNSSSTTALARSTLGHAHPLISGPPRHPLQASPSNISLASSAGVNATSGSQSTLVSATGSEQLQQQHLLTAEDLDQPVGHKPMVLIRVARQYDLVMQFSSVQARRKFIFKLQAYLAKINKSMSLYAVQRDIMLANAETKEKRKQRLEQFFREAYALTFGLSGGGSSSSPSPGSSPNQGGVSQADSKVSPDISMVMRTSLSRQEFAEALGMRGDSLFVRQMFNCIDKDRNGQISFQEFLDLVVRFSRGQPDDKLRIVFDMCDHNSRGLIEKKALIRMLRSLIDMAKTKSLTEDQLQEMIHEMFATVGLDQKPLLNYEDFKLIINSSRHLNVRDTLGVSSGSNGGQQQALVVDGSSTRISDSALPPIGLDMKGAKKNFFAPILDGTAAAAAGQPTGRRMTIVGASSGAKRAQPLELDKQSGEHSSLGKGLIKRISTKWKALATELEEHRQDIVYLVMFYVIVVVLFLERFVSYSFLSEHMDLRHIMGFGIALTRGSAASLSFCYALLLLSMCRNIMTWIRTMSVREYIPLDSHVKFHKIVAMTALVMTILHTVGHCVNFYHVTQQPVEHLRCLTKEMQFSGESRPTFFYWVFQTVTGSTGLALWILCSIVYVFAHAQVRQRAYSFFWSTHKLYYLIYALTLVHGSSKLTGSPRFWIFFIIPAILFTIDKIMSLQAKLWQLEIFETECLPSDVIALKFARPPSFKFLSGQWVRIACTAFRPHEFHAFTLTSAPQDDFLSVHVRAQGPWTWKLRNLFDPINLQYNNQLQLQYQHKQHVKTNKGSNSSNNNNGKPIHERLPPRIRIEGPFGGGNQDWYKYEVAVMIGGGIGVTPYASILNDLVFGTSTNRYSSVNYKKVYFIWICPSHRSFEWFIDVLRDVEKKDVTNLLEMHIFITQFFHKFDLRTTMLYICENHFQRVSNRSLFTGLKAINHFGRPDIAALLQQVQNKHSRVSKVGVFSCGPKPLTKSVTEACEKVNQRRKLPFFLHQYENFS